MVQYDHPYVSDKPEYKFYIIKNNNKRLYFGDSNYEDYTEGHLDEIRKKIDIANVKTLEIITRKDSGQCGIYGI